MMPTHDSDGARASLLPAWDSDPGATHQAVASQPAGAEAGPDVPAVLGRPQAVVASRPSPAGRQADLVHRRPDRVDPFRAAEQLHVVVRGAADASPAEGRARRRAYHIGGLAQRQELREPGDGNGLRDIPSLVDRSQRVDVLLAAADLLVGETAGTAGEDERARLAATNPAPNDDSIGRARRDPAQDVRCGSALFCDVA